MVFYKFKMDGVFHENSENQVLDDEIGLPQFLGKILRLELWYKWIVDGPSNITMVLVTYSKLIQLDISNFWDLEFDSKKTHQTHLKSVW